MSAIDKLSVELLLKIAGYLDQPTLARFARLSKGWAAPINNILWRRLESISPLLRLLPCHLIDGKWVLETPIRNITKFDEFAARVRVIDWSEAERPNDKQWFAIFAELSEFITAYPGRPLLPNIRSFRIYCQSTVGVNTILPWVSSSPSLTALDLTLGLSVDNGTSTDVLSVVKANCATHLTSFSLRIDHRSLAPGGDTERVLLSLLQSLEAVETLAIPLHASAGQHLDALGMLPHLQELSLSLIEPLVEPDINNSALFSGTTHFVGTVANSDLLATTEDTPSTPAANFLSLHSLDITGSFSDIVDIIKLTAHNVERLNLTVPDIQSPNWMTYAMQVIEAFCPRLSPINVDINAEDQDRAWVECASVTRDRRQSRDLPTLAIRHPDPYDAPIDLPDQAN